MTTASWAKVELLCIPPDKVSIVWPHVRHFIYRAIKRADLIAFAPVEEMLLTDNALLWVAYDGEKVRGAALTQIVQTESRQVLHIAAMGGSLEVARQLIGGIEDYGRNAGCVASRITGRQGWEKALPDYTRKRVILEKALLNG